MTKVATARKLLEWIYHMMRVGKTFKEVEKVAEFLSEGELALHHHRAQVSVAARRRADEQTKRSSSFSHYTLFFGHQE